MNYFKILPREILINIALEYDLPNIITYCKLSKRFNRLTCQNNIFWMNKFYHDFGFVELNNPNDIYWKDLYLKVVNTGSNDLLWEGIETYQLNLVKIALLRGGDIEDEKIIKHAGYLPLVFAAKNGKLELVKYLIEQGANIQSQNNKALRYSSMNGHLKVVKYLVEKGADIHALHDYSLRYSSMNGHLEVVKYLVETGANINDESLIYAIINGHLDIVKYLIRQVSINIDKLNQYLTLSLENGHMEVFKYLNKIKIFNRV